MQATTATQLMYSILHYVVWFGLHPRTYLTGISHSRMTWIYLKW